MQHETNFFDTFGVCCTVHCAARCGVRNAILLPSGRATHVTERASHQFSGCIFQILLAAGRVAFIYTGTGAADLEAQATAVAVCHERTGQRSRGTDTEALVPLAATYHGVRELPRLAAAAG